MQRRSFPDRYDRSRPDRGRTPRPTKRRSGSMPTPGAGACVAAITLLVHLLVVGLAPFADTMIQPDPADLVVHFEGDGSDACDPVPHHLDCQLCRVLSRDAVPVSPTPVTLTGGEEHLLASPAPVTIDKRILPPSALQPRAPPIA